MKLTKKACFNNGLDYRHFISYYRGRDREEDHENEIALIIEENGILYPVEIKMSSNPKANRATAFQVLDNLPEKKRGSGALLCLCPEPGKLRDNVWQIPVWYV